MDASGNNEDQELQFTTANNNNSRSSLANPDADDDIADALLPESENGVDKDSSASGENQKPQSVETNSSTEDETEDELPRRKKPKLVPEGKIEEREDEERTPIAAAVGKSGGGSGKKSSKKKYTSIWTKPTSRKGKKKTKINNGGGNYPSNGNVEAGVLLTPIQKLPDRTDDGPDMSICLSKVYKAEKVDLSEDRLTAGSIKGYRMVRATRGVMEGSWYFEIKVVHLGETGHARLGWSTDKGDLQAPVGYDCYSYGYRDVDGSKVHKAVREEYGGQGYKEGDVVGFYINLPDGGLYAPKGMQLVAYKGQKYYCAPDAKEDQQKVVPGSEILFYKNGVCQGVAFKDILGGHYYPAASMYTLPNQPNCEVKFNFGPDFDFFPSDFGGCPIPKPMTEVPYHGFDRPVENGALDEKQQ